MSENVLALAVLLLLCAPGLVRSEEPHSTSIPQVDASSQDTGVMQDRNKISPVTNSMPVNSVDFPNAQRSAPETSEDLQFHDRGEPYQIPIYVLRPPQSTRLKAVLPHGSFQPEINGKDPPRINAAFRIESTDQMIQALPSAGQIGPPNPVRKDPSNKIPIYVIRPSSHPGIGSPTLVNMAVLSPEQLNPEIIRILQSLGLSEDRVPLVLLTGPIPPLTADTQNEAGSDLNSMTTISPAARSDPTVMRTFLPNTFSDEEWSNDEAMKKETLMHGGRPSSGIPNVGRFPYESPQVYWLPAPINHDNIDPTNTERFATPRGRNAPVDFLPSQENTLPGTITPQGYYPPTGLPEGTIARFRIPGYPIPDGNESPYDPETLKKSLQDPPSQHPLFPLSFTPNSKLPVYYTTDDHRNPNARQKYFPYPSSDVQEPYMLPHPRQQFPYSGPYDIQTLYDFQTFLNPEFSPPDGKEPQNKPLAISKIGRFRVPETPSHYPSSFPENTTAYPDTISETFYPDQQIKYLSPYRKYSQYPSSPGTGIDDREPQIRRGPDTVSNIEKFIIPKHPYSTPMQKYPPFPSANYEEPIDYLSPDPQKPYTGTHPGFPYYGSFSGNPDQLMEGREPQMRARPALVSNIEIFTTPTQPYPTSQHKYPYVPSSGNDPLDPNIGPRPLDQGQNPDFSFLTPVPRYPKHPAYDTEPQMRIPLVDYNSEKVHTTEQPYMQHPQNYQQFPSSETDEPTDRYPDPLQPHRPTQSGYTPDGQLSDYPNYPVDGRGPLNSPTPKIITRIEKFIIPGQPYPQQTYPHIPSSGSNEPTYYPERGPQQSDQGQVPDPQSLDQVTGYPKHPKGNSEPHIRPIPSEVSDIERADIPERFYPKPQQQYPQFPSSGVDEPTYYPDTDPRPGLPSRNQISDNPRIRPRPGIRFNVDKLIKPEQPIVNPWLTYSQSLSADYSEPTYYTLAGPQQPLKQKEYFPSGGQVADHPKYLVGDTEPQLKPRPEFVSIVDKFSPYPKPLMEYPLIPSPQVSEPLNYPDGDSQQPSRGQHPQSIDGLEESWGPQPVTVTQIKKIHISQEPDTTSDRIQPLQPSSDTDKARNYPESRPSYPSSDTDGQIYHPQSGDQQPFYGHRPNPEDRIPEYLKRPFDTTPPEVFSEIREFSIPEESHTTPGKEHTQHPSAGPGAPRYPGDVARPSHSTEHPWLPTDSVLTGKTEKPLEGQNDKFSPYPSAGNIDEQPLYGTIPKPQYNGQPSPFPTDIPALTSYYPFGSVQPSVESTPGVRSQVEEINGPTQGGPRYPPSGSDNPHEPLPQTPRTPSSDDSVVPADTPTADNPSEGGRRPSLRPENVPKVGQFSGPEPTSPHDGYPSTQPSFDVEAQSSTAIPVSSYPSQHYPKHPSTGGEEPFRPLSPDFRAGIGEMLIPENTVITPGLAPSYSPYASPKQYTDQQPHWIPEGALTDYPDQLSPQYLYPFKKPPPVNPKAGQEPSNSGRDVPQYPGNKQPRLDDQRPQFPSYISAPKHPSFDEQRTPERPDVASQVGVLKISEESPDIRTDKVYPQYASSDMEEQYLDLYTRPRIIYPTQHSPWYPKPGGIRPLPLRLDLTPQIERLNVPGRREPLDEDYPQRPSMGTSEPQQRLGNFPLQMGGTQQPWSDTPHTDVRRPTQYPLRDEQLQVPDAVASQPGSTTVPLQPETLGRLSEPGKQVYPKTERVPQTSNILGNVVRFEVPEGPQFGASWEEYLPKGGTLPQQKFVSPLKMRPLNDIDINFERITLPGQLAWQPGSRYPQYPSADTQGQSEYPESIPQYSGQRPRLLMEPDLPLPVGSYVMPEIDANYPSVYPYSPHKRPQVLAFPNRLSGREYNEHPYKDIHPSSGKLQPTVTADVERLLVLDQTSLLPLQKHILIYPSTDEEPPVGFPHSESRYPPESQVPHDNKLPSSRYPLAEQLLPMGKLQPDVETRLGRLEVTERPGSPQFEGGSQNIYTPTTQLLNPEPSDDSEPTKPSSTPDDQYYGRPSHIPQNPSIMTPINSSQHYPVDVNQPVPADEQVHSPGKLSPENLQGLPDLEGGNLYSADDDVEIPKQGSPSAPEGYPFTVIKVSPVMQPTSPSSGRGSGQYPDSSQPSPEPSRTPVSTWEESHPIGSYLLEGPQRPKTGWPIFIPGGDQPHGPWDQVKYPYGPPYKHPSGSVPVDEEPNGLKRPTVYVYPVPIPPQVPLNEPSGPQLQRHPSGSVDPDPKSQTGTPDHSAPSNVQTPIYPQRYPAEMSPSLQTYDTTSTTILPDFPLEHSRSLQGEPQPKGYQPGTPERSAPGDAQTPIHPQRYPAEMSPSLQTYDITSTTILPDFPLEHSRSLQGEPNGYQPGNPERSAPGDAQTPIHPQQYPAGTSQSLLKYDTTSTTILPDFPLVHSRSLQGQPQPLPTAYLPGTVGRHKSDVRSPTEGYDVEISSLPGLHGLKTTSVYPESLASQPDVSPFLPDVTVLYPQPSAELISISSTLKYPDEPQIRPSTSTVLYPKPVEPRSVPSGPAFDGTPAQLVQPASDIGGSTIPRSPGDISRTIFPTGQTLRPEDLQPDENLEESPKPKNIDNSMDAPYSTEKNFKHEPVSSDSSTLPPIDDEKRLYPDEASTTTSESLVSGSTPDGQTIIRSTDVSVTRIAKQLLGEPSNGLADSPTQSSSSSEPGTFPAVPGSPQKPSSPSLDSKITRIFPVSKPTFYTDKDGQKFVSLKLLNEPISASPSGDVIPSELTDPTKQPKTTDLVIPIGQDFSDTPDPGSPHNNSTHPQPMLKGIPISNVQVFDAQAIIKIIETCNCSNLKFLIPILKRPLSAIVVANNENPAVLPIN